MKNLFLTTIATVCLSIVTIAQVPNYVSTNGLLGWWGFNNDVNDGSVNGNHGTNHGASLSTDRFGNVNKAYNFSGDDYIQLGPNPFTSMDNMDGSDFTISLWYNVDSKGILLMNYGWGLNIHLNNDVEPTFGSLGIWPDNIWSYVSDNNPSNFGTWYNLVCVKEGVNSKIFLNGVLSNANNSNPVGLGNLTYIGGNPIDNNNWINGKIDDIGIWNRALNQQEITNLYNNFNGGSSPCTETVTITVTDTLIINRTVTGFNPLSFENTIKLYPNPTNDILNIDFGNNFSTLNGYSLKINNSVGQTFYTTNITAEHTNVNINTWNNGVYFVHLIDGQNNTIDIRKIVLQ